MTFTLSYGHSITLDHRGRKVVYASSVPFIPDAGLVWSANYIPYAYVLLYRILLDHLLVVPTKDLAACQTGTESTQDRVELL